MDGEVNPSRVREVVREKYGALAEAVSTGGCCGPTCCAGTGDPISSNLYSKGETEDLPADAVSASLGCGNPTALLPLARENQRQAGATNVEFLKGAIEAIPGFASAFVRARKPARTCCATECCGQ